MNIPFNFIGLGSFIAMNLVAPITIKKFWNKKIHKDDFYHYLDEELDGVRGFELHYN